MLKREETIQSMIRDGYDDTLATELPKLFIKDYLEKEKDLLSEALDIFIDRVQSGDIIGNEDKNVYFGSIQKMSENDFKSAACDGLFYNFKSHITEEFLNIVKRRPLRNILLSNGALELDIYNGYQKYHKEIVGSPKEWQDLCEISIITYYPYKHEYSYHKIYIRLNDLLTLFANKGIINENDISTEYKKPDFATIMTQFETSYDGDIYINYDAIMAIGNALDNKEEYVPKMKPENK